MLYFLKGLEILLEILYNVCMNCEHRGILMAEAAEKLNITDLTVFFDGSFAMGLDKVVKPYITRHSDVGGGAQIH